MSILFCLQLNEAFLSVYSISQQTCIKKREYYNKPLLKISLLVSNYNRSPEKCVSLAVLLNINGVLINLGITKSYYVFKTKKTAGGTAYKQILIDAQLETESEVKKQDWRSRLRRTAVE